MLISLKVMFTLKNYNYLLSITKSIRTFIYLKEFLIFIFVMIHKINFKASEIFLNNLSFLINF